LYSIIVTEIIAIIMLRTMAPHQSNFIENKIHAALHIQKHTTTTIDMKGNRCRPKHSRKISKNQLKWHAIKTSWQWHIQHTNWSTSSHYTNPLCQFTSRSTQRMQASTNAGI